MNQDVVSGAESGASTGAVAGPWGALIGAGVGAAAGYLTGKSRNDALRRQQARIKYLSSPQYLLGVLSTIHPAFRNEVAKTFGPQVSEALQRQAALLGPSGAGAALESASALAPETAAYQGALETAKGMQSQAIAAATNNPVMPTPTPWLDAIRGGAMGFESGATAERARREAMLKDAVRSANNYIPSLAPSPVPGMLPIAPGDEPPLLPSGFAPDTPSRGGAAPLYPYI